MDEVKAKLGTLISEKRRQPDNGVSWEEAFLSTFDCLERLGIGNDAVSERLNVIHIAGTKVDCFCEGSRLGFFPASRPSRPFQPDDRGSRLADKTLALHPAGLRFHRSIEKTVPPREKGARARSASRFCGTRATRRACSLPLTS